MSKIWGFTQVLNKVRFPGVFLCLFLFAAAQSGCQGRSHEWQPGKAFKTQIIISKSMGTEFKQVELKGIVDKSTLEGDTVDFYYSPGDENGVLVGNKPLARFVEDDGVYIPADQISLQMVTLYYHLQELKNLELEVRKASESLLKWPRKVALAVNVVNSPDMKYDNAFYNGRSDALYFVPYKSSAFPIPLNPGIIAHEHFHSYFAYEVTNPLMKKDLLPRDGLVEGSTLQDAIDTYYKLYVLKIINEGLADVWGWAYSQDPDFVVISLPKAGTTRSVEKGVGIGPDRFKSEQSLRHDIRGIMSNCRHEENRCISGNAYTQGTVLARALKSFAQERMQSSRTTDEAVRKMMAGKVLNLISSIRKSFSADDGFDLDKVILLWEKQFDSLSDAECKILQETASQPGVVKCPSNAAL